MSWTLTFVHKIKDVLVKEERLPELLNSSCLISHLILLSDAHATLRAAPLDCDVVCHVSGVHARTNWSKSLFHLLEGTWMGLGLYQSLA